MKVTYPLITSITTQQTTANASSSIRELSGIKNGYIVKDFTGGLYNKKREGYELAYTLPSGAGRAVNRIFADPADTSNTYVVGNTDKNLYKNGTAVGSTLTNIGSSGSISVDWTSDSTYVYIHSYNTAGDNSYYYNKSANTTTEITDADHPSNLGTPLALARGVVSLDGYFFIGTQSGRIYNSALNDPSSWASTDFLTANSEPDNLKAIAKHYTTLAAFGEQTIEFYRDAGNTSGSVLARREDIFYPVGIDSGPVVPFADSLLFMGSYFGPELSKTNVQQKHVFKLENFKLKQISTPDIDHIINRTSSLVTGVVSLGGKNFLLIDVGTSTAYTTLAYDLELDVWYNWTITTTDGVSGNYFSDNTLNIYRFPTSSTNALYTDNGSNYEWYTITNKLDQLKDVKEVTLGNRKFLNYLQIMGDRPSSTTNISVSWSDDDYQTFSTARTLDISSYKKLSRLGVFRERAFKLSYTGSAGLRVSQLLLDINTSSG